MNEENRQTAVPEKPTPIQISYDIEDQLAKIAPVFCNKFFFSPMGDALKIIFAEEMMGQRPDGTQIIEYRSSIVVTPMSFARLVDFATQYLNQLRTAAQSTPEEVVIPQKEPLK